MIASKEKHIQLADILSDKIRNRIFLPGQKIPSQNELGRKYSMSRTSVHYAFNELENRGIIVRKPGKGIYVRDDKKSKELKTVSVILPDTQRLELQDYNNFGLEIFWGIEKRLREKNLDCKLRVISNDERDMLPAIISRQNADGVIIPRNFTDNEAKEIAKLDIPVVMAGRIPALPDVSGVAFNIFDYYSSFCNKLINEGNKKITIFSRKDLFVNNDFELLSKFLDKQSKDVSVKIVHYADIDSSITDDDLIYKSVQEIIDNNDMPDVFIGVTDWVAFRIIEKLTELGISVPGQVKVIGCLGVAMPPNDLPEITTFDGDAFELGRRAVDALCKSSKKHNEPVLEKLSMEYIERETYRNIK